ncbi:chemotaxis protein [Phenylobacterium deserti]|uniref:Chemotaxis protein n=2 Tax=Phenylobacterium deserti TaxID=1914756 RepID=A0A328AWX3_9CAUL|nr:chemotaxis protein [Phenylobacterium deserti]
MRLAMNIPKKLSFSFVLICVSAAIMMVVFLGTILMIRASTASNNSSQSIHADALALETAILRQNSQFRGFLVTGDESYLKSYYEGRDEYDSVSQKLGSTLTDPAMLKNIEDSRTATLAWRKNWGDRLIEVVKAGRREEAQEIVRSAGSKVLVSAAVLPLRDIRKVEATRIAENGARQQAAIFTAIAALVLGGIALIAVAMTLSRQLSRTIARPITTLTDAMTQLANGDNDIVVDAERSDELGDMARAVLVFRDAALAKAEADRAKADADRAKAEADAAKLGAEAAQRRVVETLDTALAALASGDLTHVITKPFEPEYERLRQSFNSAVEGLEQSISGVAKSARSVRSGASDIYSASEDLSRRTEQQASRLQETTTATKQVTVMVAETAQRAANARSAIEVANGNAREGGEIVSEAIAAMDAIQTSSEQISQIISLIDAITFQTNLLALNAGVEAARAGDAGRGFAVVASEVRALAQRSADAARDIKQLINTSSEQVQSGVGRVGHTGEMLTQIGSKIRDTNALISEIAQSTETQADNLNQVSGAVASMDSMTQQNAAMVKEATAAARSLAAEADELATLVSRFRLRSAAAGMDAPVPQAASRLESERQALKKAVGSW